MNKTIKRLSLFGAGLLISTQVLAESVLWKDSAAETLVNPQLQGNLAAKGLPALLQARKVTLDISALNDVLGEAANLAARPTGSSAADALITIPLPQGGEVEVRAEEVLIMAPKLAKQFPHIKTWRVIGENDAQIHGRIDQTGHGFHAMLVMPDGDTIFVEPDKDSAQANRYLSFSKHENHENFKTDFQCSVHSDDPLQSSAVKGNSRLKRVLAKPALSTKVYRLAVAATGEYTHFHGGNKGQALSAIVTTINRVNDIFEQDLSISLELIGDETNIIYTNASTDPYTNDDVDALLEENIVNLSGGDLSKSSFDIGHVFGAGNVGGLAQVASACDDLLKAGGATGIPRPIGDAFSISFVAHELGHQLGATHTFNSNCRGGQRTAERAVEPGSGSTIMSYAGVCGGGNDLQNEPDPQFHAISILDILEYTRNYEGSSCGRTRTISNQDPDIDAGSDYTLPTRTPFKLSATASDSDDDVLRYTWEQMDTGSLSSVDVDTGDNAIFRSRGNSKSGTRYIPRLIDLFDDTPVKGEHLPVENREVNFVATVRDGKGGVQVDTKKLRLVGTGRPFAVTSHRYSQTLRADEKTTVSWDVAGTDGSPISCSKVDISFIEPNGNSFHLVTTANDGEERITIPDNAPRMSRARLMVACSNNIFFNVSRGDLIVGKSNSDGGGAMGYLMIMLATLGLIRRKRGLVK